MTKTYYIKAKNITPYGGFEKGQVTTFTSDGENKLEAIKNFREYYSSEDWEILAAKEYKELLYNGELYKLQILSGDEDVHVTRCPWCGGEHDIDGTEMEDSYDEIDDDEGFYRHKKCHKLVKISAGEEFNSGGEIDD